MPSLDQWEQRLLPYFNQSLHIIGEIPLTWMDVEDMLNGVRACIQRNGMANATQLLTEHYPHLFLTFLVGFGAQNTEQSFWIALSERLGVNHNHLFNYRWHYAFQNEVRALGLPLFDSADAANPFVTTIRFHGGIPAYSLPDFFERLLLPTIKRPALSEAPTKQAMDAVLKTAYFVDSPVINFLENSGSLGVQFFDSCRKLANHYLKTQGDLLSAADLGLPEYVVEAFKNFMERNADDGQSDRLRKPILGANPFGDMDRLWLKLPQQEIDLRYAGGTLEWQIEGLEPGTSERVACQLIRRRQDTVIKENFIPIETIPAQLIVSLVYTESDIELILHHWRIPVATSEGRIPLIAFRTDGQQVRLSQALPAEFLRLVYPWDANLLIGGRGSLSEMYGRMSGAWLNWQIQEWDLTEAWSVQVIRNELPVGQIISVAGRQLAPELFGGALSPYSQSETPLYIGELPVIRIPLRSGYDTDEELARWQIEVNPVWDAVSPLHRKGHVSDFREHINLQENLAYLSLEPILGREPVGTYEILMDRLGGSHTKLRLRIWPSMTLIHFPKRLLPPENNNLPVSFVMRIPANTKCEAQAGAGDVQVDEDIAGWKITTGPDVLELNLNLIWYATGHLIVRVPISLPIPRIRWALSLDQNKGQVIWTGSPLQKSADELLQSGTPTLHVKAYGLGDYINRAQLELVECDNTEQPLQISSLQKTVFSPDWLRVSLRQFSGTLRNESQQGRFDLVLLPRGEETEMRFPLLLSPRSMDIRKVTLTQVDQTNWKLTWDEDYPLKNRRFMLIAAWQPWQEPWEYKIPDEARGTFLLENVSLPKTRYNIYFYVAPTWEHNRTTPPSGVRVNVISLSSPKSRLAEIGTQAMAAYEEQFRILVEEMCIYNDLNELDHRDELLSQCLVPFNHLTNLHLMLSLLEWLDLHHIVSPYQRFLWRSIFDTKRVEAIFQNYKATDPLLCRYLGYVSRGINLDSQSALLIAERSDNPAVIHACLKQLVEHKEEIVILLLQEMIDKARLSNRDAVDLLALRSRWSIEKLASQESSPQVDCLLAGLLPHLGNDTNLPTDFIYSLIIRVMPYESNPDIRRMYLETLVDNQREEGVQGVLKAMQEGSISLEEGEQILSRAPELSFRMLQQASQTPFLQKCITWLAGQFPKATGVIRPRYIIQTPIGVGRVDYIEDLSGIRLQQTMLSSQNAHINLVIGDGADRFRVWLNLDDNTMRFFEAQKAWQCNYCGFVHPDRRCLEKHYNQCHPNASRVYRGIPATISINRADLKII